MRGKWTEGPWFRDCTDEVCATLDGGAVVVIAAFNPMAELNDEATEANARLGAAAPALYEALEQIADESVFNQLRFAEEDDTDYFLRCFKAVKDRARAALCLAHPPSNHTEESKP